MGKKSSTPAAPKPDENIGKAALMQAELGKEWLEFARLEAADAGERQKVLDNLTMRVGEQQIETQDMANQWARDDRARWEETFRPLEDRFIQEAQDWDSPERQAEKAAQARADVIGSAAGQQQAQQRQMASMGLNPASGRFQSIDNATAQQTALAAAGAQNQARENVQAQGMALRSDAINLGRGLPSQAAQGASLGLTAGGAALGGQAQANQMATISSGIMGQGFQGAMAGQAGMASTLNQQYGNQLNAWSANRQAAAQDSAGFWGGLGSMAGTAAGLYLASSKDAKTNKRPVEGSAMAAIAGLPVEAWDYKPGMGDGGSHIGPYAEDFQAATGQGDGKTIPVQDMLGLHTKAIQELGAMLENIGTGNRRASDLEGAPA